MLREILTTQFRLLSFRKPLESLPNSWRSYLGYVIVVTWVVGMGRYWDSPTAPFLQKLGLGSLVYLFVMSAILWVAIAPISNHRPSYSLTVIFVGMTALPAVLYAIPVELFLRFDQAATANLWFLVIVAAWRVILLFIFCSRAARLTIWGTLTATLLPLTGIMITLATFSLEHVTFELMSGMRVDETFPRTIAGEIASNVTTAVGWSHMTVNFLSFISWILFPIFLISYIVLFFKRQSLNSSTLDGE